MFQIPCIFYYMINSLAIVWNRVNHYIINLFKYFGHLLLICLISLNHSYIVGQISFKFICFASGKVPIDNLGGRRDDFIADILKEKTLPLPNNGSALLHPVHVKDVSNSFVLAIKHQKSIGQKYNICGDKAVEIKHYLEITAAALDRTAKINYVPLEDMIVKHKDTADEAGLRFFAEHMCYDITKARTQLEYTPQYTAAEAIEENARWAAKQN